MNPRQIELEQIRLKASKIRIKKRIEKEEKLLLDIGGENMLKVIPGEASKCLKS